jgi:hypothetical protein
MAATTLVDTEETGVTSPFEWSRDLSQARLDMSHAPPAPPPAPPAPPAPTAPPPHNARYKTTLCKNWSAEGKCRYGKRCQFAHGPQEIRPRTTTKAVVSSALETILADVKKRDEPLPGFDERTVIHAHHITNTINNYYHEHCFSPPQLVINMTQTTDGWGRRWARDCDGNDWCCDTYGKKLIRDRYGNMWFHNEFKQTWYYGYDTGVWSRVR